jgi:hypothetical protein
VAVFVWRVERARSDTKTPEARRTLALSRRYVEALREHRVRQAEDRLAAGSLWQDHGLVFASAAGTPAKSRLALPTQDFMPIAGADRIHLAVHAELGVDGR